MGGNKAGQSVTGDRRAIVHGRLPIASSMGGNAVKRTWQNKSALACLALAATLAVPSVVLAETKIGTTLEEIIELAKNEPTVTLATTWEGEIIDYAKNGFKEKYGLDMEFVFVTGVESRERIFNESLAGVNEMDLVNMSSELADKFVASPAFVRGRIYLRGLELLYCIAVGAAPPAAAAP